MSRSTKVLVSAAGVTLLLCPGCTLDDALIDGFFGGISDTIAAIISNALLQATGATVE